MEKISKLKILVDELTLGMHVVELDRAWLETDFLIQGFIINNEQEIDALIRQCDYVFIEGKSQAKTKYVEKRKSNKGLFLRKPKQSGPVVNSSGVPTEQGLRKPPQADQKVTYINKIDVEKEMAVAQSTYASSKQVAKNIMDGIRLGRILDMNQARECVDGILDSILRNNNALVWLTKIKEKDDYTAEHSLNVCILSIAFAQHLGHNESEIRSIGLGGVVARCRQVKNSRRSA